jgi:hypothetical protein
MKRILPFLFLLSAVALGSCTKKVTIVKTSPPPGQVKKTTAPGQVKKATGSQSAKPYAPGQQKKKN